ncbi:XdhC family protein, partial [Rhizobium bangladeshense]|uniref:XdhC family protein n=1 Tax=Rhizobium bangladeshense TaxID=1138189 RepID=UPI0018D44963
MSFAELSVTTPVPIQVRVKDDDAEVLKFAVDAFLHGGAALATLVEIRGGAARAIGSQIAVATDGSFCGYVSGGCVEAAVATEALLAIAEGKDRVVEFGLGSRFFDIVLPCGGG